ncbi:tRNA preQ1(34) S-adenosylmethionine ribosyltransferase-isomerase QueA [Nitrosomonas sp. Nm132]|jgi:S-adenosylmethionine:tRNA ribosyltransferase-isomerase|uniref:tRNA preQ1(34) S-adenosylmethionine ribosyltransferase-isomerase QueA n=1 Tax=Nitrosomonas sp. Nm132 TaxID=1881053 RepID=UPI00088B0460|nr:tRNA preQ1(34) S-adenosylmethionine ribosyltransferase-isomerase QueA [Nitrosomonas sp. Nm132]SDH99925.1 S-adenosylmethionine:tRNA ribosyltransferase-isomerase [Nitrosomonas sp. Nm132]
MRTQDFDFFLPSDLIAQFPPTQRTDSRMLYLDSPCDKFQDTLFIDLPKYLRAGDVIVFNDTRVIKARLWGIKQTGGKIEVMVERVLDSHHVLAMIRASHAPKIGSRLLLENTINAIVQGHEQNFYILRFTHELSVIQLLEQYGSLPLPPYIERQATQLDEDRYQTIFAKQVGAVAAPTAGLHFDEAMLINLREIGVVITYVTLHVGAGTFQPVRAENILDHQMHTEIYYIPAETIGAIQQAKGTGNRVLAVGSTSLRALEACAKTNDGQLKPGYGETNLFVMPGFNFRIVDRLLTNFHLPRSTLLMMVSAFAGMENIHRAYQHAITQRYHFFSYGDAMLIERKV